MRLSIEASQGNFHPIQWVQYSYLLILYLPEVSRYDHPPDQSVSLVIQHPCVIRSV